jgi:hypothetical protein
MWAISFHASRIECTSSPAVLVEMLFPLGILCRIFECITPSVAVPHTISYRYQAMQLYAYLLVSIHDFIIVRARFVMTVTTLY